MPPPFYCVVQHCLENIMGRAALIPPLTVLLLFRYLTPTCLQLTVSG